MYLDYHIFLMVTQLLLFLIFIVSQISLAFSKTFYFKKWLFSSWLKQEPFFKLLPKKQHR